VEPTHPSALASPLLDALAVAAVVGAEVPDAKTWARERCEGFELARNEEALPRVRLVARGHGVPREEMETRVTAGWFDPQSEALWVGEGSLEGPAPLPALPPVRVTADFSDRLVARTRADVETILVVADSYDPGWHATVDGRPARILCVWGLVRGVRLPAGPHVVEMTYRPHSFVLGAALSLLGIVLSGCALAAPGNLVGSRRVL
jgi:hypothetical protein